MARRGVGLLRQALRSVTVEGGGLRQGVACALSVGRPLPLIDACLSWCRRPDPADVTCTRVAQEADSVPKRIVMTAVGGQSHRLHGLGQLSRKPELLLTIFVPFKAEGEAWKCGFTFGPLGSESIRYGLGEDFIEALLDALAMARGIYEGRVPKGWGWSGELQDCGDLPYKIGRSFLTEPRTSRPPGEPDFSAA